MAANSDRFVIIDSLFRNNVAHNGGVIYSQDAVLSVIITCYNGNTVFGNRSDEHLAMFILRLKVLYLGVTSNSPQILHTMAEQ